MRTYISIILVLLSCVRVFAQENIIVPISKPSQNTVSSSAAKTASIKIRLACELNGERRYYSTREWSQLEVEDRDQNNIIGVVIGSGDSAFLISPYNNMGRALSDSTYSFQVAMNKTGGQLPTRAQLSVLSKYRSTIEWAFGGEVYSRLKLWSKEGYCIDMKTNAISSDKMAAFRIATDDVDNGFYNVVVEKQDNEEYDYIGQEAPKGRDYLQLVKLKEKFGYVDTCGKVRIPMKFDDVNYGRFKYGYDEYWNGEGLMPVSINGKWGYINTESEVIIPIVYDKVEQSYWIDDNYYRGLLKVYRGSSVGAYNIKGEVVFPLKYGEIERYYGKDGLYYVKDKNYGGKYGFFDSTYQIVIPFKYGAVGGFNYRKDVALCYVGNYIDEKGKWQYGYIDRSGKEVIPLIYDLASRFYNGLAAVIKDGKLGYINESGDIVIPISFDYPYETLSIDEDGRKVQETFFGSSFKFSPYIAFVYQNGKYAIIRNDGKLLSDFKYDKIVSIGSCVHVQCDTTNLFIDIGGNEYISEQELRKNSNRILAEQGYAEGQYDYGMELLNKGDIEQATLWLHKAGQNGKPDAYRQIGLYYEEKKVFDSAIAFFICAEKNGDMESILEQGKIYFYNKSHFERSYLSALVSFNRYLEQSDDEAPYKSNAYCFIGEIYYYGGFGVSKSYSAAFENFSKSVALDAYYFIGWMYEHGQGVSVDIEKAIDYYRRCKGERDSKERIDRLLSMNRK